MLKIILDEKKINQLSSFLKTLVIAIIVVYLTGFMRLCGPNYADYTRRAPPDDELIRIFKENRKDFELLINMALEDAHLSGISLIAIDFFRQLNPNKPKNREGIATEPDEYFPEKRWNTYRKLFKKLKVVDSLNIEDSGKIHFYPLRRKNYVYSKKKLEPVYKSLDGLEKIKLNSPKPIYRKIDECWYLYYEPDPWF